VDSGSRRAQLLRDDVAEQPVELGQYVAALKRNVPLVLLIVVPLTGLVLAFSLALPQTYRASARLVLDDTSGLFPASDVETVKRRLATIEALLKTPPVLGRAAERLKGQTADTLAKKIATSVDPNANLISVTATDRDRNAAATVANAVATAYLTSSRDLQQKQLATARARLLRTLDRLHGVPAGSADAAAIQARLSELSLEEASAGSELRFAQTARPPAAPFSPRPVRNTVFAFFAALFIAMFAVLAREHVSPRVEGPRALSRLLGLPILAAIPLRGHSRGRRQWQQEAYEALRAVVELQVPAGTQSTLLVAGAVRGQGATEVAAQLAKLLADAGRRTLLVEGDLRRPRLHELFDLAPDANVRHVLAALDGENVGADGPVELERALASARVQEGLWVLGSGSRMQGAQWPALDLESLFDELRGRNFDYVIVAGAPLLGAVDAQIIARLVDFTLIVARPHRLPPETAHDLRMLIELQDLNVLGVVAVDAEPMPTFLPRQPRVGV
jgi:capsular polysaccharide biosynthesis protein/Mrp family chromosome partitioning ATPase